MYLHKVAAVIERSIETMRLEIENMEPGQVNQYNESKESLTEELAVIEQMAQLAADLTTRRNRAAIDRMSKWTG